MVVTTIYERVFLAGLFYRRNRTLGDEYQVFSHFSRLVRRLSCTIEVQIEQNRTMSRTNTYPQTLQVISPPTSYGGWHVLIKRFNERIEKIVERLSSIVSQVVGDSCSTFKPHFECGRRSETTRQLLIILERYGRCL